MHIKVQNFQIPIAQITATSAKATLVSQLFFHALSEKLFYFFEGNYTPCKGHLNFDDFSRFLFLLFAVKIRSIKRFCEQ